MKRTEFQMSIIFSLLIYYFLFSAGSYYLLKAIKLYNEH